MNRGEIPVESSPLRTSGHSRARSGEPDGLRAAGKSVRFHHPTTRFRRFYSMRKNLNTRRFLSLALVILTTGCLGDSVGPVDPADQTFATELGVNLSEMTLTQSGLYYKDEVVGTGAVATLGSAVTVDYTGWLHTGFRFDGGTFTVPNLGAGAVIAGWDEGLQ